MFLERFQESRWMVEDCRVDLEGLFICLTSNLVKKKKNQLEPCMWLSF